MHRSPDTVAGVPRKAGEAVVIRKARPGDADEILRLVDALANYEQLPPPDEEAKQRLIRDLFLEKPRVEAWLAWVGEEAVGYSFVFETYSTFRGLPILYLEDLFVMPEYRGRKVGYALFSRMLEEAKERGCARMEWSVLDWNQLAIDFYQRLGATHKREWHLYRIDL